MASKTPKGLKKGKMIVNTSNEGWEIISQYAHGLLAGRIAEQIQLRSRPKNWVETITAIIEHDDNQIDLDMKSCLSENGSPMDFTLSKASSQDATVKRVQSLMEVSRYKSRWIALLISAHLDFLYNNADAGADMKKFLKDEKKFRKNTIKIFDVSEQQLHDYYQVLRFCDRLSLILCKNQVPTLGRKLEINKSIDNKTYFVSQDAAENTLVEPWCFEKPSFTVSVESRYLQQPTFASGSALKKALAKAPVTLKQLTISSKSS